MIKPLIKLKKTLKENKLDAALISSIPNIVYLTGYSGFSKEEREAYLFITENKQYVLTDGRYSQAVKTLIPNFRLIEISSKLSFEKAIKQLIKKHSPAGEAGKIKKLGFEGNNLTFLEHKTFSKHFNNIYHLSISDLRSIKTSDEISKIEKACKLGDKTFDYVLKKIKLGISEKEVDNEIEFFIKRHGADISFPPIVAFGPNSAIPHHVPTAYKLQSNQIVLLDFGVKLNNYCSDMTRTIFFGKPSTEQKRMYETVLNAQQKSIEYLQKSHLRGGRMDSSEVDKLARNYIISQGYKTIPHSLGHGIGIDVHESPHLSPKSKDILKQGMVFSIEPGIYKPNFGGVRIEDLVVLEKNKLRPLTHSPKTIIKL